MFTPTDSKLFFTKNDSTDTRLGDLVKPFNSKEHLLQQLTSDDVVIIGYPDDEGIKNNGGRLGAHLAPQLIRQFFYKMTPSPFAFVTKKNIFDLGDLNPSLSTIESRHQTARETLNKIYLNKNHIITFGGGHDYGFPDAAAFIDVYKNTHQQKPIVINFDAHMDVRPYSGQIHKNTINSGTPFYRLYEEHQKNYHLIEVGIQPQCNSAHHIAWAKDRGAEIVFLEHIETQGWNFLWEKTELKNSTSNRPIFVSFDIDALKASEAGGCSQAWITGLAFSDVVKFLNKLYQKFNVPGLGIYEVSPPFDRDFQTVKAAALLAHQFIFNNPKKIK